MSATYLQGHAYFLPDGTEVIYTGPDEIFYPRFRQRPASGPVEALNGRTLSPRMVECEHGHTYHLRVENFPLVGRCPECGDACGEYFRSLGFSLWHTGGGCSAWGTCVTSGDLTYEVMVTEDSNAPEGDPAALYDAVVGIYELGPDGDPTERDGCEGIWHFVRSRPEQQPIPEGVPAEVIDLVLRSVYFLNGPRPLTRKDAIAEAYADVLSEWLSWEEREAVRKGANEHDYCDANMALLEACEGLQIDLMGALQREGQDALSTAIVTDVNAATEEVAIRIR